MGIKSVYTFICDSLRHFIIKCDWLYYKMQELFYNKVWQTFITKCARCFITKCDCFIRKCDSFNKMRRFYYKMRQLFQNGVYYKKPRYRLLKSLSFRSNFIKKEPPTQVFFCKFYEILKNFFFDTIPPVAIVNLKLFLQRKNKFCSFSNKSSILLIKLIDLNVLNSFFIYKT